MEHTFSEDGFLPTRFKNSANTREEVFIYIGESGAEDLGGGTIKIIKVSPTGKLRNLKPITSLADANDRWMRVILPANSEIDIELSGSTSPTLGVEIQSAVRGSS